jgi:hypothetical protein
MRYMETPSASWRLRSVRDTRGVAAVSERFSCPGSSSVTCWMTRSRIRRSMPRPSNPFKDPADALLIRRGGEGGADGDLWVGEG